MNDSTLKYFTKETTKDKLRNKIVAMQKPGVPFWDSFAEQILYESNPDNPNKTNIPLWNLSCTKRDLSLYCKLGMKPNRHWQVGHVKNYFGITGTKHKLEERFIEIYLTVMLLVMPETIIKHDDVEMLDNFRETL